MIDQILATYRTFSDSTIMKIEYFQQQEDNFTNKICCVYINSYNWNKDIFENLVLTFKKVNFFRFKEIQNISSLNISDALLKYEKNEFILDFFPNLVSDFLLEIN